MSADVDLLTQLLLDGEGVAVGVPEPGDPAVIQHVDSFPIALQLGFVILLECHTDRAEFIDDSFEIGDVPATDNGDASARQVGCVERAPIARSGVISPRRPAA